MFKKIIFLFVLCVTMGCVSTRVPSYLTDKKPFERRFYAGHTEALAGVKQAMTNSGWVLEQVMEPQVYELDPQKADIEEQLLLMTEVRERRRILFSRYERMNIFIRSRGNVTDVEMRYLVINDMTLFKSKTYGNEKLAKRFFDLVQKELEK
jgi:hypothetical protein